MLTLLGDKDKFHYKRSRRGNAETDRIVELVLKQSGEDHAVMDFYPYGYDERQYGSPGFNLPVGRLSRAVHGEFPEYHTSADNLDFIHPEQLAGSLKLLVDIVHMIESNKTYINLSPRGEPFLGKRLVYDSMVEKNKRWDFQMAMLWVLNMSDGTNSLLDISERSGLEYTLIEKAAENLEKVDLLKTIP